MESDCQKWCSNCPVCQRVKAVKKEGSGIHQSLPLKDVFDRVSIDLMGPITVHRGPEGQIKKYVMVMVIILKALLV